MAISLQEQQRQMFAQSLKNFLQPIGDLLEDESITEIMVNGFETVYIERKGRVSRVPNRFMDDRTLMAATRNIAQFVGRTLNEQFPRMDARLPDGSRVHVVIPPLSRVGTVVSIRKFSKEKLTVEKLMEFGAITPRAVEFLRACMKVHKTIMISGGTGSGKTSLLNVLTSMIDPAERILVIEDSAELQVQQEHVIYFETRPPDKNGQGAVGIRDLLHSALRLRPDRIVIGEIRGGEALDLLQAMTSGHTGALATVHANQPKDTLSRLETLAMYSGTELPLHAIRSQVASAMEVVVQTSRFNDGSRKITHITEILDLDDEGRYHVQDLFRFVHEGTSPEGKVLGKMKTMGNIPTFYDYMVVNGVELGKDFFKEGLV